MQRQAESELSLMELSRNYSKLFMHRAGSMMTLRLEDWGHTASPFSYSQPGVQTVYCIGQVGYLVQHK